VLEGSFHRVRNSDSAVVSASPISDNRHDHVIAAMVQGLGGHVDALAAPFDPEGGAYAEGTGGHHHDHHAHDHGHDHEHAHG